MLKRVIIAISMKKIVSLAITAAAFVLFSVAPAPAADDCAGESFPHGNYCEGQGRGWYGERKAVRTEPEARRILREYFSSVKGVRIKNMKERRWFFEAEIRDKDNRLIDVVIIDKRSGRIRSIY